MRLFFKAKDGGPESNVTGYWLIESKRLFSIALLCFDEGSREAMHSHAFNAVSWVLSGELAELRYIKDKTYQLNTLGPSVRAIYTSRDNLHQVYGIPKKTWVLTFRGPWVDTWIEYFPKTKKLVKLASGRKIVG